MARRGAGGVHVGGVKVLDIAGLSKGGSVEHVVAKTSKARCRRWCLERWHGGAAVTSR